MLSVLVGKLKRYLALEGILILVISDFLFVSGTSLWHPYLNIYYSSIGLSAFNIGLISTLQSAVSSLTMMPGGIISDRIGRKKPIVFSFILTLIYTLFLIVVQDYPLILIITCIQGVAIGLRTPVLSAYILDVIQERRGLALATFHLFTFLATILGTAIGAQIAEALGYQNAFLAGSVIILIAGVYTLFKLEEPMAQDMTRDKSMTQSFKDGIILMGNTSILILMAGCVVHQIAASFATPYIGLYLKYVIALDLISVGVLLNARQIGDVIGQLPGGMVIDRIGPEAVLFIHVFLTAPIVYFFGSSSNPYLLSLILFVWGSEQSWDMPSRRLLINKYSKGTGSATALGSVQSFIGLMALLSPVIGGWIWDNLGPGYLFQISALANTVACIPLAVLMWKAHKKGEKH